MHVAIVVAIWFVGNLKKHCYYTSSTSMYSLGSVLMLQPLRSSLLTWNKIPSNFERVIVKKLEWFLSDCPMQKLCLETSEVGLILQILFMCAALTTIMHSSWDGTYGGHILVFVYTVGKI